MNPVSSRTRGLRTVTALAAATLLTLTGCANPEGGPADPGASSGGGQQVTRTQDAGGPGCSLQQYGVEKIDLSKAVVGFSQSEKEANPFRIAETASITAEAKKLGARLITTNANSDLGKQISDIQSMLAQGAQLLIVAPLNSEGLEPALRAAREKKVPVITVDRKLSSATACKDYLTFIGSDFVDQGRRAGEAMAKVTGGTGKVAILLGSSGNNVTTDRTSGFKDYLKASAPGLQIVAEQTGDFAREKGQQVTEQLLQANPGITAVYAQNDEMALGAVTAIRSAGKKPGQDIKIVSVDGTRNAVESIVAGEMNAVIESNPRFGPLAFQTAQKFYGGESIGSTVIIQDKSYDSANAKAEVANAY
ncbi:ABC transporter substrate-binding protein [Allokutzneria oryzae]|uniref:ABC transporter substrate-binding protein n=1 Tax=Allokutzneria oryzae TaxID=1378989 RepID=A0ABV6A8S1_9PSEU